MRPANLEPVSFIAQTEKVKTDIDDKTIPESIPGIAVDEVVDLVACAARQALHGAAEALCALWILSDFNKHGHVNVPGIREATLRWLLGAGPLDHGVDGARSCGEKVRGTKADPVLHGGVVEQDARGGGMSDEALARLAKDAIRHCVSHDALDVDNVDAGGLGDMVKGYGVVEGHGLGKVETVYGIETQVVVVLGSSVGIGSIVDVAQ